MLGVCCNVVDNGECFGDATWDDCELTEERCSCSWNANESFETNLQNQCFLVKKISTKIKVKM